MIVVTHFLNPIDGTAPALRPLSGMVSFGRASAYSSVADDSNQNKHVISAANSARLPLLVFTDSGICRWVAIWSSCGCLELVVGYDCPFEFLFPSNPLTAVLPLAEYTVGLVSNAFVLELR